MRNYTIKTSLEFLQQKADGIYNSQLKEAQELLQQYQNRIQITNTIKQEIQQREQLLKEQLYNLGFVKELQKINKDIFYYNQQLNEYKTILKDPKRLQAETISTLCKTKLFQDFIKKHGMLARLFCLPDNNGSSQALAGLQTRASIQEIVNQRFNLTPEHFSGGGNGINPQQFMQQQIQAAQTELTTLKDKINQLGSSSSDMETPNFIPNSQKTKSF